MTKDLGTVGNMGDLLGDREILIKFQRKVDHTSILPVVTYGVRAMSQTVKSENRLRSTQRDIERQCWEYD